MEPTAVIVSLVAPVFRCHHVIIGLRFAAPYAVTLRSFRAIVVFFASWRLCGLLKKAFPVCLMNTINKKKQRVLNVMTLFALSAKIKF